MSECNHVLERLRSWTLTDKGVQPGDLRVIDDPNAKLRGTSLYGATVLVTDVTGDGTVKIMFDDRIDSVQRFWLLLNSHLLEESE